MLIERAIEWMPRVFHRFSPRPDARSSTQNGRWPAPLMGDHFPAKCSGEDAEEAKIEKKKAVLSRIGLSARENELKGD